MKTLSVSRYGSVPGMGTFGQMLLWSDNGEQLYTCRSVEREWLDNLPSRSCIPGGVYKMELGMYYGGDGAGGKADYPAYEIQDVENRSLIKIHVANYAEQLLGCIAPGLHFGVFRNHWSVVKSKVAFDALMGFMDGDQIVNLEVSWGHNPE
jgi:hypothetical protein